MRSPWFSLSGALGLVCKFLCLLNIGLDLLYAWGLSEFCPVRVSPLSFRFVYPVTCCVCLLGCTPGIPDVSKMECFVFPIEYAFPSVFFLLINSITSTWSLKPEPRSHPGLHFLLPPHARLLGTACFLLWIFLEPIPFLFLSPLPRSVPPGLLHKWSPCLSA